MFKILFFALSAAFALVHVALPVLQSALVKSRFSYLLNRKPVNCVKCMTGWISLFIYLLTSHGYYYAPAYLCAGLFVGALFEAIQMRYL